MKQKQPLYTDKVRMKVKFKKGWVSMNKDGTWIWWPSKPVIEKDCWVNPNFTNHNGIYPQAIVYLEMPRVKDWTKSLKEV